jgi:deoxyadenosine/deoxycytidine kinase
MERNNLIIIEGPQGTGKSTLSSYLRDNIASSNLYRLSGQRDKTNKGLEQSKLMYDALFSYLQNMQNIPMDMIFDRTFTSEEVYARLGYKEYSFTEQYKRYSALLNELYYKIYYFNLYLENVDLFRQRLDRPSHHNYQAFSLDNSVNQQNAYRDVASELSSYDNINVIDLPMDNFEESYDQVRRILKMEKENK